jgi:hypothetical protein
VWHVWGLTIEEEEELLATCNGNDTFEITPEEEEELLLCTCRSEDLLRNGSSDRLPNPRLRVRADLFAEVSQSEEIPSLINIMPVEEDEVQIIEPPEIEYIKTVVNITIE